MCLTEGIGFGGFCCNFGPATSGWTVFDNDWTGSPIMPSDNPFKWRHFEPGLILTVWSVVLAVCRE